MKVTKQFAPRPTNRMLAVLPLNEYERLAPHLHQVRLTKDSILYDVGDQVQRGYFVQSGVVSLISTTENNEHIEAGLVGDEGMVGIPSLLRYHHSPFRVIVQIPGEALSLDAQVLRREFKQGGELQDIILCFMHSLVSQFARTIICNRFHTIEKRLARWLLMTRDRAHSDSLHLTHEFISTFLGAARTDVTKAAGALQDSGLIRYRRGLITILDGAGLEAAACVCYQAIKNEEGLFIAV